MHTIVSVGNKRERKKQIHRRVADKTRALINGIDVQYRGVFYHFYYTSVPKVCVAPTSNGCVSHSMADLSSNVGYFSGLYYCQVKLCELLINVEQQHAYYFGGQLW